MEGETVIHRRTNSTNTNVRSRNLERREQFSNFMCSGNSIENDIKFDRSRSDCFIVRPLNVVTSLPTLVITPAIS
jgi:hypothetical protein